MKFMIDFIFNSGSRAAIIRLSVSLLRSNIFSHIHNKSYINQTNPSYIWEIFVERIYLTISAPKYNTSSHQHSQIDMALIISNLEVVSYQII